MGPRGVGLGDLMGLEPDAGILEGLEEWLDRVPGNWCWW